MITWQTRFKIPTTPSILHHLVVCLENVWFLNEATNWRNRFVLENSEISVKFAINVFTKNVIIVNDEFLLRIHTLCFLTVHFPLSPGFILKLYQRIGDAGGFYIRLLTTSNTSANLLFYVSFLFVKQYPYILCTFMIPCHKARVKQIILNKLFSGASITRNNNNTTKHNL